MHTVELVKEDGRRLTLYGRQAFVHAREVPSPRIAPGSPSDPHLRWHPFRGEWVAYAAHRQHRTFLPPPEYDPLRPTIAGAEPTELPDGDYDVAVFDNLFPTLVPGAEAMPLLAVPTQPARGRCEVVVYSRDPATSLGRLPVDHVALLLQVWGDRTRRLAAEGLAYALAFENRGVEVGVTLHHPHGQIYAYPFVPPVPAASHRHEREHHDRTGRALLETLIETELGEGRRLLYVGPHAVAFVPAWARYPYEAWVAPLRAVPTLADLEADERVDLARALRTLAATYDALWSRPFPYLMSWHQAPLDGAPHPEVHLRAEFHPPFRAPGRLKYLAGTELAGGLYANDALPEEKARELQRVLVESA